MKIQYLLLLTPLFFLACKQNSMIKMIKYHDIPLPNETPIVIKPELTSDKQLIHRGLFSPDGLAYYYTLSDSNFQQFTVKVIRWEEKKWLEPQNAFFNSDYNEHGMSFSADGQQLYFSSTRPVPGEKETSWQLWSSEKKKGVWQKSKWIRIPEFEQKIVSHPSISRLGTLYFHAANQDYSEMKLYRAKQNNGNFTEAEHLDFNFPKGVMLCTPYVDPDERYLIFALVADQLELMISYKEGNGQWGKPEQLPAFINQFGQGNPTITSDGRYLLYATGGENKPWEVKWVSTEDIIHLPLK